MMRGFSSTDEHDEAVLGPILELSVTDEVWLLGDVSGGQKEEELHALGLLRDAPASLHLIAGNHDSVSAIHRNGWKHQRRWLNVFTSVQSFGRVRLAGRQVLMSHFPYARSGDGPDRDESRYLEFRLPDEGFPLLHGHTHQMTPHMLAPDSGEADLTQFCVSWDAHRGLVAEHELNGWLSRL